MDEGERLQKTLARAGFGSRRACEILISEGRVTIDGRVAELGNRVDPDVQVICVDGSLAPTAQNTVYFLLNKPDGVVTTASDPQGRTTVLELVESPVRIFPVGRLDMNTEGLLILTNDGRLAHLLTHPEFRDPQGVPGPRRGRPVSGRDPATARRRGTRRRRDQSGPGQSRSVRDSCASSSTRGATVRSGGCAPRSVTTSRDWCARASVRSKTPRCRPARLVNSRWPRCVA